MELSEYRGSVVLEGEVTSYQNKVELGWAAAKSGFKSVVNDIGVIGLSEEVLERPRAFDGLLDGTCYDVVVIGGGVVGSAIARELSRWNLSVALLEKEGDVAVHTSSRNDGMIHDGFAAKPGSKKAEYNVRGNRLWEPLCKELGIEFKRPGSLILFHSTLAATAYPIMAERARRNRVDGWEFWSRARVAAEEPDVVADQHGAFFLPSAGVLSPYKATVALAESARMNGVHVVLEACVLGMELEAGRIERVVTNRGTCRAGVVINAAGNWADVVAAMAGDRFFSLHQRRGAELILDAASGSSQRHILGMPRLLQIREKTKGGGLVKTVEGNILVGPTASESPGREDYATRPQELLELKKHLRLNTSLAMAQTITYFSGVRPCTYEEDFIIEKSERVSNLVHAAGIQSPGLASAPAIAQDVARMAVELVSAFKAVGPRPGWISDRPSPPEPRRLPLDQRAGLIERNSAYGRIVCRCEEVSEGEILDAIHAGIPATNMDAIKRRTRAGMGRCHGGFCTPRVMEILARETGTPLWAVTKKGPGSELCVGPTKRARP
ncbi:MAG: hypothetical protein A2Y38_05280 [Spirochaetes bacterium GWB1_59_5]|nr:MAG: hypothetical protein A2Y38_05280 [Spirochaetes bacterium GWB1_59_5]